MMSAPSLLKASLGLLLLGSVIVTTVQPGAIAVPISTSHPQKVVAGPIKDPFLLKVRKSNGFCMQNRCYGELIILENGTYRYEDATKAAHGKLDRRAFARFKRKLAQVNLDKVKSKPFKGLCPSAYDAPETSYLFLTGNTVEQISECQYEIDLRDPLFKQANQFYNKVVEQLYAGK